MKKVFLIFATCLCAVCEVAAQLPSGSATDPVVGTSKRPDPAMESVAVQTKVASRYKTARQNYGMTIGIERTKQGRIWCCRVGGGDNADAYFLLSWSDDNGDTWTDTKAVLDPHDRSLPEQRRTIVGNLWCDPDGRLWLFYDVAMTYYDGRGGTWATVCDNPDVAKPVWSEPRYVGIGFTLNKPTVLSSGEWLLPESLWQRDLIEILQDGGRTVSPYHDAYHELDDWRRANVFISTDKGATWTLHKGVVVPEQRHDENMITELRDGRVMMTIRSKAGWIYRTISTDKGLTWGEVEQWQPHVNSRHFIRRLSSGRLLLVRHGMTDKKLKSRSHLRAFLSDDDGKTWQGGMLLDERKGVSYPDGFEAPDGYIYISYDRNRAADGEILLARFTENDILQGKVTSPRGVLRQLINAPARIHSHPTVKK